MNVVKQHVGMQKVLNKIGDKANGKKTNFSGRNEK